MRSGVSLVVVTEGERDAVVTALAKMHRHVMRHALRRYVRVCETGQRDMKARTDARGNRP